jgi:hypothetical protein
MIDAEKFAERLTAKALTMAGQMEALTKKGREAVEEAEQIMLIDALLGLLHFASMHHDTLEGRRHYVITMMAFIQNSALDSLVRAWEVENALNKDKEDPEIRGHKD